MRSWNFGLEYNQYVSTFLQTSLASSLSFGDVLDVRVLKTYDIVVHVRRMVVTSTGVRVSMAVGGTAAVDWVRLRAGVFTGHTAAAVMVSRGHWPVTPTTPTTASRHAHLDTSTGKISTSVSTWEVVTLSWPWLWGSIRFVVMWWVCDPKTQKTSDYCDISGRKV